MEQPKVELLGLKLKELEEFVLSIGQPRFRANQLFKWIYKKKENSFYEMSDLPKDLRYQLSEIAAVSIPRILKQRVSKDGTRKYLVEFKDKKRVETVVIPQSSDKDTKYSLCLSTQVGCPIGCSFCATGQGGFQRNLSSYEIVGQVLSSSRELAKKLKNGDQDPITNIVYMGMGEPMLNYNEMIESICMINDKKGINIGQRHITISTAGDVGGINKLAEEDLQVTLAISLHASSNSLRDKLVPLNRKYPIEKLIEAVKMYINKTNRRVTFEYILLDDVNISKIDAYNLALLVKPLLANINLIPYNEVEGLPFKRPSDRKVRLFYNWLINEGVNVTIREEKGIDIDAACGQLAVKKEP
ncbi:MAG TPA: 23S rRNA (adenine(2503)-C(2))-methyltransferase RlmN [Syntrophomonadaceae bacterium]|nr:23S rRNA (adenine(2503)-C(2))-methyltransferase RlmN [Syntrophomonadaceae bacterium]